MYKHIKKNLNGDSFFWGHSAPNRKKSVKIPIPKKNLTLGRGIYSVHVSENPMRMNVTHCTFEKLSSDPTHNQCRNKLEAHSVKILLD